MDEWLDRFARELAAELGDNDEQREGEWPEPDRAGSDVSSWAASPSEHHDRHAVFQPDVSDDVRESLLELARVVAHGTERRFAPLSTFLAGQFVAIRVAQGADPLTAAEQVRAIAERLLE